MNGHLSLWIAKSYLKNLVYESRFPHSTKTNVLTGRLYNNLKNAQEGDIHIMPTKGSSEIKEMIKFSKIKNKFFLFVTDSNKEDVLA